MPRFVVDLIVRNRFSIRADTKEEAEIIARSAWDNDMLESLTLEQVDDSEITAEYMWETLDKIEVMEAGL